MQLLCLRMCVVNKIETEAKFIKCTAILLMSFERSDMYETYLTLVLLLLYCNSDDLQVFFFLHCIAILETYLMSRLDSVMKLCTL